jgi:hypothetical protein
VVDGDWRTVVVETDTWRALVPAKTAALSADVPDATDDVAATSGTSDSAEGEAASREGELVRGAAAWASEKREPTVSLGAPRFMARGRSTANAPTPATITATPQRGAPGGGGLRDMLGKLRDDHAFQGVSFRHDRGYDLQ